MRSVYRRNNQNKEILIYIHLTYVAVIRAYTTRIAKQHNELLSGILLLLLIRPMYLGICPDVHLNTHTSIYEQGEWLLETDED